MAVRVAAANSSAVIGTLTVGKRVHVQQAIRGGKGKIWGRLLKPPGKGIERQRESPIGSWLETYMIMEIFASKAGWILLADQQAGYRAVQKAEIEPKSIIL